MPRLVAVIALLLACLAAPALAQSPPPRDVAFKQVADDIWFLFEFTSSNAVVLVTDEGVLVIDTRQHPRDGADLAARSVQRQQHDVFDEPEDGLDGPGQRRGAAAALGELRGGDGEAHGARA